MVDYHDRYVRLNQHLNDHVHPKVNAGAAATDDLWLTDHGPEHVATVISRINDLTFRDGNFVVSPYEAYLLLVSAHFHDVGNVFGRGKP